MKVNGINRNNIPNTLTVHTAQPLRTSFAAEQKQDSAQVSGLPSTAATDAIKAQINIKTPVSYTPTGDFEIEGAGKVHLYKLANGQRVAILNKKGPTVLKTYYNVGSMNEPDNIRGVSHFAEHMKFNGTDNLASGDFFRITNNMGAATNASTGFSITDYYIMSQLLNPDDLEKSIQLQSDMLQNPKYAADMIEKEKGPVTSEISMVADSPENVVINNCIRNLFRIETTSPDLVAGSIANIQNLTRDDAYNYFKTWYTPDNAVTVVTGEVDPDKTINLLAKYFNSTRTSKPEDKKYEELKPITSALRQDVRLPKAQSTTTSLGFAGPRNDSYKDQIVMQLALVTLLGYKNARLSQSLDKMQTSATFATERMNNKTDAPRAILIVSQSTPEKSENVAKAFYEEINSLAAKPVAKEELETVKNLLKLSYFNICESSQALNSFVGLAVIDNCIPYSKDYLKILESITPEDITEFSKKYFDLNKASLSVVHPASLDSNAMKDNYNKTHGAHSIQKLPTVSFKGKIEDKTFDLSKIKQYRLGNNMEVAFNPNSSDLVSAEIKFDARIPAATKPGVAELLLVMLNEGSFYKAQADFYLQANKKGMDLKFYADEHSVGASVNALSADTNYSLDLVKEVINQPRFNQDSLNYAKEMVKESVLNTDNTAGESLLKEFFPDYPEFATKEERLKSIESATLGDVVGLYDYIMKNAQATATFTAPVEKTPGIVNDALHNLSIGFREFKPVEIKHFESYTPIAQNKTITKAEPRNQADIVQGYKFKINYNPKDMATIGLMSSILGEGTSSRLFNDLRETQKLAYRVESGVDAHGTTGIFFLGIKTTTDNKAEGVVSYENVAKSLDGFKKHIEKLKTEKVTDEELAAAKLRQKTRILNAIESSAGQTGMLSNSKGSYFGLADAAERLKLIDQITADDIHNAANYIFNSNPVISVLASQDTLDNMKLPK